MSDWKPISSFINFSTKGITPKYVDNSSIIVLNQKCIRNNKIDYSLAQYTYDKKEIDSSKFIQNGDILVNSTGAGTAGRCAFVSELPTKHRYIVDSHILIFRCNFYHEAQCLNYLLFSFEETIMSFMTGSSGQSELDKVVLLNIKTKLTTDTQTQQRIASVLSSLDAKIELNNKINRELEAMAKMLYDYWFVQFNFPDKNGKPYKTSGGKMVWNEQLKREIPEGWEAGKINDFIEVKDGTHDSPKPKETGYYLITSKNLLESGLDFDNANLISEEDYMNINKRSKVDTGDILFSMIGSIGVIYKIEETDIKFAVKNVALYKTSQKKQYKNYIYQYLKSYDMQYYMSTVISGSIQKFIGLGSLRDMPLLFNREVIELFISKTNAIYSKMNNIKNENQCLSSLRDWLLPMLMNGQVTVQEAEERISMVAEQEVGYGK
jgi:type I restriction enzyme S subunit